MNEAGVGLGDISPTNTAEIIYTFFLLWISLILFSGCLGILMNYVSSMYEEGQERRTRMIELSKYMQWRVLPRDLKMSIRRYLVFVWDCNDQVGETESHVMEMLSPSLRMSLCLHIFVLHAELAFFRSAMDCNWAERIQRVRGSDSEGLQSGVF